MCPIAKNRDGSPVTGRVVERFINVAGRSEHAVARRRRPHAADARHHEGEVLISAVSETPERRQGRRRDDSQHRLGVRGLPDRAVSGHAGPARALPEERLRSGAAVRAGLHGERSVRARRRHGGDARRRVVLPLHGERRRRHGESDLRPGPARHRDGQLAVRAASRKRSSILASTRTSTAASSGTA